MPARSLLDLKHLVRRDSLLRQFPLVVRQDHFYVNLLGGSKSEMRVGWLPGGIAVARGDLAAAEQRGGLTEFARGIDLDARADAHAVDCFLRSLTLPARPFDLNP